MKIKNKIVRLTLSIFIVLALVIGGILGYFAYKKNGVEKAVREYLIENGTAESEIESLEPFVANLSGDKNYMVAVNLKNDERTYYYYKDTDQNEVILESYTLDGETYMD